MDIISYDKAVKAQKLAESKQDELVSGANIKTVNGQSIVGSGDISSSTPVTNGKSSVLGGTLTLSNTVLTKGFSSYLHTGNGTAQDVQNGINLKDTWQDLTGISLWSAGTYNTDDEVYIEDTSGRQIRCVCLQDGVTSDPNTLLSLATATFSDWKIESGTFGGQTHIKGRESTESHIVIDTLRGANEVIFTNLTNAETTLTDRITAFNIDGFSIGSNASVNANTLDFVSWTHQTTHIVSGLTNHNKPYIIEYNPVTLYMQVKYEGSGITGHRIPNPLGRKLSMFNTKNLSVSANWVVHIEGKYGHLNLTNAFNDILTLLEEDYIEINYDTNTVNTDADVFTGYGWANSYYDDNGELNGIYNTYNDDNILHFTVHDLNSKDNIAFEINKTLTVTGDWNMFDYERGNTKELNANLSNIESTVTANSLITTASPIQYPKASETSNITATDLVVSYENGVGVNGVDNTIENVGSITFTATSFDY